MIGIGVIGYGYWGPNLVRNFVETPGARVVAVSDARPDRLALAGTRYSSIRTVTSAREVVADPAVDAVVVATPAGVHFELAMASLDAGKHVLVEKPMAESSDGAARLVEEAARRRLVLMVDHTFVYASPVRKIRALVADGALGDVYHYDAVRTNRDRFQADVDVLWDLAVHDLAILDHVLGEAPVEVSATGLGRDAGEQCDIAYLTLFFTRCLIAHVHVNRVAPVKVRRTLIGGARRMIVYDDLEPSERVRVYDRERGRGDHAAPGMRVDHPTGEVWAPRLEVVEPLRVMATHFVECVSGGRRPETDGEAGLRVIRLLEAATASLARRGRPVSL